MDDEHDGLSHPKDGSGAIAIKMIHTDSKWTIFADVIRLIFSILLLIFSTISVIYAIAVSGTTMPSFEPWAQYIALAISLFILGVLEGLQIAVVELAHKNPKQYEKLYPRAAKLLEFENRGRNVERFLMGRQVLVVFTVFVAARITTFDVFWIDGMPQSFINTVMYSGFLGVILVVIVAQLTPQVLSAAYPVEFLNLPGMTIAFWACLIVEATGLVHAVWFLCVVVRNMLYKCVCHAGDSDFGAIPSTSNVGVNTSMLETANKAEIAIDEEVEMVNGDNNDPRDVWRKEYVANNDDMDHQMNLLVEEVGNRRDLFYIYGDNKYLSPSQCYDKFKENGMSPPRFLLPPDNAQHIPPHIVAMTLLKMYTEKCEEIQNMNGDQEKDKELL